MKLCALLTITALAAVLLAAAPPAASAADSPHLRRLASDPAGGGDASLSPDGRQLVLSSRRTGQFKLWLYDIAASAWSQLTRGEGEDTEPQWSPDGAEVVFTSTRSGNKDVCIVSPATREIRQLTTSPDEDEYAMWSPDGTRIIYVSGPWKARDFYTISAAGGKPDNLTRRPGAYGAASFYPDGAAIVYHAYDSGAGKLYSFHPRENQTRQLTFGPAWDYKGRISPDGKIVAFSRAEESLLSNHKCAIVLMSLESGRTADLTVTPFADRWPNWDQSGDRLAFHRIVDGGVSLRVWNRARHEERTIVQSLDGVGSGNFDPTGQKLVFSRSAGGRSRLFVHDLATAASSPLESGAGDALFPRWAPDGKSIAFVSDREGRWNIYTLSLATGECRGWTASLQGVHGMDGPMDWSPDSSKLVFRAETEPYEARIFMLDLQDGKVSDLTRDHWYNEAPVWSPDGQKVTFMSTRGGDWSWGFFSYRLATGQIECELSGSATERNFPRWLPSGELLFSAIDGTGQETIAAARHGKVETEGWPATPGARWISTSPDGSEIVYTVVEHRTEYWLADGLLSADSVAGRLRRGEGRPERLASSTGQPPASFNPAIRKSPTHYIRRCLPAPGWAPLFPLVNSPEPGALVGAVR